ncbi:D-alanyl-D-alanine carboxypeptidase family protein [Halothiobacillus sp.]|jgi:D-alanyl-D-alanine carboxypeptidase (penicillin-binding protein 5/6)|uniref:D-alanyl-D-alanine carboxypeptidase family protein n=1 Tax=Halothiobacillus sp. TaxID=1891311 RepID=UPI002AD3312F|nr:D-alanyl-D-alanine carboxypeptidase family protein [Halothiobacillus sp.]
MMGKFRYQWNRALASRAWFGVSGRFVSAAVLSLVVVSTGMAAVPVPDAPAAMPIPGAPVLSARSYVLLDANTDQTIVEKNADEPVPPASITKLMTSYLIFSALKSGQIHLTDMVTISKNAWEMQGSKMFIEVGKQVSVENLLRGMIVQSGNDAATALAEYVGGNQASFVSEMNATAKKLGMTHTHYEDPTGWPAPGHVMSARDISILFDDLVRRFPEYYHEFFRQKEFTWNGIKQFNREKLLFRDNWVDGGKTGHTEEAGYCLATSGQQNGMRLIAVVLGTESDDARNNEAEALLNYGFRFFENVPVRKAGDILATPEVYKGVSNSVPVGLVQNMIVLVPKGQTKNVTVSMSLTPKLVAPLTADQPVGKLTVKLGDKVLATRDVVALKAVPKGGFFKNMVDSVRLWF